MCVHLLFITTGHTIGGIHDELHWGFEAVWKVRLCEGLRGGSLCALEVVVDVAVPCVSGDSHGDAFELVWCVAGSVAWYVAGCIARHLRGLLRRYEDVEEDADEL